MNESQQFNYYKLLENIKDCYDHNLDRFEIPFSCAKDYPVDLCYKLQNMHLKVDFTKDSILIKLPIKRPPL